MVDTFTPVINPSTQSRMSAVPRTNTAQFGDGYTQRSSDGLNAVPHTFSAVWPMLWDADADAMEAFFAAHVVSYFLWAPKNVTLKWIAVSWERGDSSAGVTTISASFKEVFDP